MECKSIPDYIFRKRLKFKFTIPPMVDLMREIHCPAIPRNLLFPPATIRHFYSLSWLILPPHDQSFGNCLAEVLAFVKHKQTTCVYLRTGQLPTGGRSSSATSSSFGPSSTTSTTKRNSNAEELQCLQLSRRDWHKLLK